jgi:hypothetical protein
MSRAFYELASLNVTSSTSAKRFAKLLEQLPEVDKPFVLVSATGERPRLSAKTEGPLFGQVFNLFAQDQVDFLFILVTLGKFFSSRCFSHMELRKEVAGIFRSIFSLNFVVNFLHEKIIFLTAEEKNIVAWCLARAKEDQVFSYSGLLISLWKLLGSSPALSSDSFDLYPTINSPGHRHDNDKEDFRSISILPTLEELLCKEKPYFVEKAFEKKRTSFVLEHLFRELRFALFP